MIKVSHHFARIAPVYRQVRTTDLEPIVFIKKKLRRRKKMVGADVGCGAGRYTLKLLQHCGKRLFLYCIDASSAMLRELEDYLKKKGMKNFQPLRRVIGKIPLADNTLDCIFTFNAIHHLPASLFFSESSRTLKPNGYLFIYTRLRSQNRTNIWGRYFPYFYQKETRLFSLNKIKTLIRQTPGLRMESIQYFSYYRTASLDWLLTQAKRRHYSTFCLYTRDEFKRGLVQFKENIRRRFPDLNKINWLDENTLLVIRKQG
ncbi:MAG: class I SAM-dependent methyltransferase [candidate division WOR-3 bacterium]